MRSDDQLDLELDTSSGGEDIQIDEQEGANASTEHQEVSTGGDAEAQRSEHAQELEAVSDTVQRRISKLTARMREAERREEAAVEYARGLQNTAQQLQQKLTQTDYSRLNEAKTRMDTQAVSLKQIIRKAREEGDYDTESEAQERLTNLTMEQRQVAAYLQQAPAQQAQQPQQQSQQQQPQQQAAARQPAKASPKAEKWAQNNSWFGQDRVMTYAAWGVHQTLVEQEGIDPESDEYYTELDSRLRTEFPQRFKNEPNRQQRPASAVASASRSSGVSSARKTVKLSPSQVAIARKLGVPLEEYAKYVKD